jgi:DNA-nicking Smr family endonuclease
MSKRRKLRPEEEALWDKVASTTERLHAKKPSFLAETGSKLTIPAKPLVETAPIPIPAFKIGQTASGRARLNDLLPSISDQVASAPAQMDRKSFQKMKRGKLAPEGRIDLHGMTLAQAHPALTSFILQAQMRGFRLVLVITGKGKDKDIGGPIPERKGALRHQVPQWLKMAPLGQAILQISEAHLKHGGGGAYYVYLRRRR